MLLLINKNASYFYAQCIPDCLNTSFWRRWGLFLEPALLCGGDLCHSLLKGAKLFHLWTEIRFASLMGKKFSWLVNVLNDRCERYYAIEDVGW